MPTAPATPSMRRTSTIAAFSTLLATALITALPAQTSDQEHAAKNVFGQLPWRELGPVQSGGRIVDLEVHPKKPQVFWAAAASGGLWNTTNGGLSFTAQFQQSYSISIGDLAVSRSNPDVLYLGTGEANNQRSSYWGDGVHKSTDGGKTWQHMGLSGTDHIGRIAVHPDNPHIVYVAALGALYRANDERGLYKTTDGGTSWQCVKHLGADTGFVDVLLDPQQPDTVYAASYERRRSAWNFREGGPGSRLWKSTDAGATWVQLDKGLPAGNLGRIGLAAFAGDGKVLYATIENLNLKSAVSSTEVEAASEPIAEPIAEPVPEPSAEVLADPVALAAHELAIEEAQDPARRSRRPVTGGEVYRSDDAGASWQKTHGNDIEVGGNPGYYYGQIRIDPQDKQHVWVLSVQIHQTRDGGKTWSPSRTERKSFGDSLHVDNHALWVDPDDGKHCLLGNDGGLAITWDGGEHWDHLTHLPILQYYTVAADNRSPYRVYGGLQDNGTWGFPIHGETSSGITAGDAYRIDGGDGFFVCIDPENADVVYSESQFGGMSRQHLRTGERKSIRPRARKGDQPLRWNWSTPILLSPHDSGTVYVGSQHLHRSHNRGDSWTTLSKDLTTNDVDKKKGNVPHCTITSLAESKHREGWLWVGTDDGKVWTSKDGGQRWTDLTDRFPAHAQGLWVSRIEASPHAEGTAFVAFTGYRVDRREPLLFRTDDGGETWLAIAHDLPMEPINVVKQHPRNEGVLLVGTEMGIYVSVDAGAHWLPLGKDLPRVAVHDLIVHSREHHVLVGTHGRGIWALDAALLEDLKAEQVTAGFRALPPSDGVLLRRAFSGGSVGARTWMASNPFTTATFRYLLGQDSEAKVLVEVLDATGAVLWKKEAPQTAGYHEVPWQSARGAGFPGFGGAGGPPGAAAAGQGQGGGGRGGFGRGGNDGPRAGQFAVRITHGEEKSVQAFSVVDRRGTTTMFGGLPAPVEELEVESTEEEEGEHEAAGEEARGGR